MLTRFIRSRGTRSLVATFALVCVEACYAYVPLPGSAAPRVAERARVSLTADGTRELARYLGPNVVVAEGAVSSVESGTVVLAVDYVQTSNGVRQPWTGEGNVSIPAMYRSDIQERTFQKRQTIVASTALVVALIATAILALRSGSASTTGAGGGGQPPP